MKKLTTIITLIIIVIYGVKDFLNNGSESNKTQEKTEQTYNKNRNENDNDNANDNDNVNDNANGNENKRGTTEIKETTVAKDYHLPAYTKKHNIVHHKAYSLSYNKEHNTPNWVAWHLTSEHTSGPVKRSSKFWADPEIPKGNRVDYYEYKESGYDRGHMCPAGDNKWDETAMYECFYMSNMCPQDPTLNGGAWGRLEAACREWANTEGEVYIVCGPIYNKGEKHETIGITHKINVPEGFFKAVLSLRKGEEKAIGFLFNNNDKNPSYKKVATSVDNIEKITGFDLFHKTDDNIERAVEAVYDINDWK